MALPYTMLPPKNPHPSPKPLTKPINSCSLVQTHFSMKFYSPPSQLAISTMPKEKNKTIEEFCLHRKKIANNLLAHLFENHTMRRRISYIKE